MFVFHLFWALSLVFLSLLPGVFIAFALFRELSPLERFLLGLGLGMVILGLIPFSLYIFARISFSFQLALVSLLFFYAVSLAVLWLKRSELVSVVKLTQKLDVKKAMPQILLLLVVLFAFLTRLATLSPIYEELDPYYYLYTPYQILTHGHALKVDWTAWYPEVKSGHLGRPDMAYLESVWYRLYAPTGYNPYLLSSIGNLYPPLAGALAVFFIYLALRREYDPYIAVLTALLLSSVPIFFLKTVAGEAEAQPFAFFALSFLLAALVWFFSELSWNWAFAALTAFVGATLGSASGVVAVILLFFAVIMEGFRRLLTAEVEQIREFVVRSFVLVALCIALPATDLFLYGVSPPHYFFLLCLLVPFLGILAVVSSWGKPVFKWLKEDHNRAVLLGACVVFGLLFFISPLAKPVRKSIMSELTLAEVRSALWRTIAEQSPTGAQLASQLGFLAMPLPFSSSVDIGGMIVNNGVSLFGFFLSVLTHKPIVIVPKAPSLLPYILIFVVAFTFWEFYARLIKAKGTFSPFALFSVPLFGILFVGWIKSKFLIYFAWALAVGIGSAFGELAKIFKNPGRVLALVLLISLSFATLFASPSWQIAHVMFKPRFSDDPAHFKPLLSRLCHQLPPGGLKSKVCLVAKNPVAFANESIDHQFDFDLCILSLLGKVPQNITTPVLGAMYRCSRIRYYWIETMDWIRTHTEPGARILSWWDYGHWINYFGMRNAVIRNEHLSHKMIMRVAYDFIMANTSRLAEDMRYFNASYVLFDREILFSGSGFGGKFGALNYLACAYVNATNASNPAGASKCEWDNRWEEVYVPESPTVYQLCQINANTTGIIAYAPKPIFDHRGLVKSISMVPKYCFGKVHLFSGAVINGLYDLNETENGHLRIHRAFLLPAGKTNSGFQVFDLVYTYDPVWPVNDTATSGFSDHQHRFYDSPLYQAFVLEHLPGFKLVYETPGKEVKIYKLLNVSSSR